jgi:eukaryotic-like serine/threonine-protein kinase
MLEAGQIIEGKYRIVRLIGEGGMGSVYEGENTFIKRRVAIKVLHAHSVSEETVRRFEREAQAAGCIGSDHILEVLDLGSLPNGDRFMVMEYLDGETLGARMSRSRMNPADVAAIARQVLVGLRAAHLASIVHRDLKPDNIFILREKAGRADYAKIIDFGISKFNALGGDMSMTRTGAVMGTPYYMSPEQAQGTQTIDGRSDVYSLGVILYEALAGAVPFDGDTFNELMFKIVLSNPRPLAQVAPGLDPRLIALVERAMARDITQRFQSADDMIRAIDEHFGSGGSAEPRRTDSNPSLPNIALPPAATGLTTGNTWAASHADLPKNSSATAYLLVGAAVLLLAGGAFAAYQKFGSKPDSAAKVAVAAPPEARAAAPVAVQAASAPASSASGAPLEPASAPAAQQADTEPPSKSQPTAAAPAQVAVAKRPIARPKPVAPRPAKTVAKSSRDFGY